MTDTWIVYFKDGALSDILIRNPEQDREDQVFYKRFADNLLNEEANDLCAFLNKHCPEGLDDLLKKEESKELSETEIDKNLHQASGDGGSKEYDPFDDPRLHGN